MKAVVLAAAAMSVVLAACASRTRSDCSPVTGEFLAGGPAYRECEVSLPAKMRVPPLLITPLLLGDEISCHSAWFEFVVDTNGRIIAPTVKLASTNSKGWSEIVLRSFPDVRYRPAEKGTTKVQQLVRYRAAYSGRNASTGSLIADAPTTAGVRPNC